MPELVGEARPSSGPQSVVFVLVADGMLSMPRILRAAFTHPWVASYQVGFGPPLVRATPELHAKVKSSGSALDKLDVYLEHCVLDSAECARLADRQRKLLVRMKGPVEAEDLDAASTEAIDLSLRLYVPATAPVKARRSMEENGVDMKMVPANEAPEPMTGRFVVRLADPRNERLLYIPSIADAKIGAAEDAVAMELRVPVTYRVLWMAFLEVLAYVAPFKPILLGDPASHARVSRDGERS